MLGLNNGVSLVALPSQHGRCSMHDYYPYNMGDLVRVAPRNPDRPDLPTRIDFKQIYIITNFYISVAGNKCAYVMKEDGGTSHGLLLSRLTFAVKNPAWEV